jgi:hypothetical protein
MARLIITPDDDGYSQSSPTFLVYDSETKQLVHTCSRLQELNAIEFFGQRRPTFRPYGITDDTQYMYVVSHNKLGKFDKNTYKLVEMLDVPLFINTHKLLRHRNNMYVTNTSNNTIGIYDMEKHTHSFFDVNTLSLTKDVVTPDHAESHDTAHVNSLSAVGNKIYFGLNHLNKRTSQFGCFNVDTYEAEIVAEAGLRTHGVQLLGDKLYALSSGTGEIVEVDLHTKDVALHKVVNSDKTYLRGLDVLDGTLTFCGSNTYSEDSTIYMNNCFAATFDTATKKANVLMQFNEAYIISDMKVLN